MSKKSITKEETFLSEKKNVDTSSMQDSSPLISFTYTPKPKEHKSHSNSPVHAAETYTYVMHDIKQTTTITALLFFTSIILYFLIQNRIVNLTIFGY